MIRWNDHGRRCGYATFNEELLKDQVPPIKDIMFKTTDGKTIEADAGWYILDKQVKIIMTFESDCQTADLFVTPSGTETYKMQQLIETVNVNQNVAEYVWNVPDDTHGYFNIIAYNKNVGRKSDYYNVVFKAVIEKS